MTHAHGADELSCQTSLGASLSADAPRPTVASTNPATILFETGTLDVQLGDTPTAHMSGGVLLRQDNKLAAANAARYDGEKLALYLEGDVRYEDPSSQILSQQAEFGYGTGRILFEGAEFSLDEGNGRGAAEAIEINEDGTLSLNRVEYTTCPPGEQDWLMQGKSIVLDTNKGVGTAKGMKLRLKNVPILYLPYISFPLSNARKSGLLTPEIGSSGRSGNELRVPIYWNIAPNYDATITPRLLTDRGLQTEVRFRYLTPRNEGSITADYLPDDNIIDATRHQVRFDHQTLFGNDWRNRINFIEVSDSQYYEDLGGSLSVSSTTQLNRHVSFDYYAKHVTFFAQVQDYQTIDDAIVAADEPYQRLPQILVNAHLPVSYFNLGVDSELVNFDRDVGVTGWRFNAKPSVEIPISRPGWFITPAVALDYTKYELSDTLPGEEKSPSRTVPIASLDTGLVLERSMAKANHIQTIEPRLLYVNIPYEDQDDLPVFDTIVPDINLVQLYRKNRFLGGDRVGDTEQVSLGVTTRVLDLDTGKERMSATIGQTRYFDDREVSLPGMPTSTFETSDYIAQVRFGLLEHVNFDVGHQWGTGDDGTTKSEARLQYRPANNKILNLAYRFRRDSLEQGDLSWSWPMSTRWNFVGRYNYSFRDQEALEQFFGLEYESCCWGLRMGSRRHISTRDGTHDSSFGLQLVLKGMSSVGTAADKLLERGILGYSADLR